MAKYELTQNYILAKAGKDFFIKVLAEDRWRKAVTCELVDGDTASKLEEGYRRDIAAEQVRKARLREPALDEVMQKLEDAQAAFEAKKAEKKAENDEKKRVADKLAAKVKA